MMHYLLFFAILLLTNIVPSSQNVGYIGPACAVVENYLFIHGIFVRKLEPQELVEFYKYEGALAVLRQLHEAVAAGSASVSSNSSLLQGPEVPQFCNGLDGTLEIVLNGCIVRKNHVYMAGRIVRPLTTSEKEKIDSLIHKSTGGNQQIWLDKLPQKMLEKLRAKRQIIDEAISNETKESYSNSADPLHRPQNDIANLLGHFLHINASVAQRFIPPIDLPKSPSPLIDRINENLVKEWGKEIAKTIRNNRRRNSHTNENFAQQNEQQKSSENHHTHLRGRRFLSVNPTENESNGDSSMTSNSQYSHQPNPWMGQQHFPEQNLNYPNNFPQNFFQPTENHMHPSLSAFQFAVNPQYPPTYYNFPTPSIGQQPAFPSANGNINIKPGESVIVGGQTYVAVPMSSLGMATPQSTQNGQSSQPIIGLMPTFKTDINLGSNSYQQSAQRVANFWPPHQTEETINNYQGQNIQQQPHHFSSYPNNPTAAISSFQNQQMPQQFPSYPYYYHQPQSLNSAQPQHYYQQYLYGYGAGNNNANANGEDGHHEDKKIEHSAAGIDELPNEICEIPSPF